MLLAPDRQAPAARAGGVITIARGPQAAGAVWSSSRDAGAGADHRPRPRRRRRRRRRPGAAGTVALDADTFVIRGRVRCLRTTRTSAVIGVSARTISLTTGRQETRSGVVVLERRPDSGVATYQLETRRTPPDCGSAPRTDRVPFTGRVVITRR